MQQCYVVKTRTSYDLYYLLAYFLPRRRRRPRKTTHKTLTKWAARRTSQPWRPPMSHGYLDATQHAPIIQQPIVYLPTVRISTKLVAPVSLTPLLETCLPCYSSLKYTHIAMVHCSRHQWWRERLSSATLWDYWWLSYLSSPTSVPVFCNRIFWYMRTCTLMVL